MITNYKYYDNLQTTPNWTKTFSEIKQRFNLTMRENNTYEYNKHMTIKN